MNSFNINNSPLVSQKRFLYSVAFNTFCIFYSMAVFNQILHKKRALQGLCYCRITSSILDLLGFNMIAYTFYLSYQLVLSYKVSQSCTANSNTHHGLNTKYYDCLEAKANLTCYYKFYPLIEMIGKIISLTQIYEWINVANIMFWQQPGKDLTETLLELKDQCFFESRRRE